jgi:hypothetical protein
MSSSHIAVVTILIRGVGLAIAKDFEHNETAKEIRGKANGAELYVPSISKAKQPLEEIMEGPLHSTIHVNNSGYHFDSNTWYKIDDELESIREVGLNGSMRICRNVIDTRTCCHNFFGE